jgi:hypothetical protein
VTGVAPVTVPVSSAAFLHVKNLSRPPSRRNAYPPLMDPTPYALNRSTMPCCAVEVVLIHASTVMSPVKCSPGWGGATMYANPFITAAAVVVLPGDTVTPTGGADVVVAPALSIARAVTV